MAVLVLSAVLVLVIGGCVCVFLAARGDAPRWVRGVAKVTVVTGELVSVLGRKSGRGSNGSSQSMGDDS